MYRNKLEHFRFEINYGRNHGWGPSDCSQPSCLCRWRLTILPMYAYLATEVHSRGVNLDGTGTGSASSARLGRHTAGHEGLARETSSRHFLQKRDIVMHSGPISCGRKGPAELRPASLSDSRDREERVGVYPAPDSLISDDHRKHHSRSAFSSILHTQIYQRNRAPQNSHSF